MRRLFLLIASSHLVGNRGVVELIPMSPGVKLTYRNVNPSLFPPNVKPDDPVPYGAN